MPWILFGLGCGYFWLVGKALGFSPATIGGLMLTGGERSFGTGGYFKSPLDEVLQHGAVGIETGFPQPRHDLAAREVRDRQHARGHPDAGGNGEAPAQAVAPGEVLLRQEPAPGLEPGQPDLQDRCSTN